MSKKAEPSLTRFGDSKLRRVHDAIYRFFPELVSGELDRPLDVARKRAFNGTISQRWFKYQYLRSQCLKRYQHGSISAADRQAAAIRGYMESEERCKAANEKLSFSLDNSALMSPHHVGLLKRSRKVFLSVLGDVEWDELFSRFAHSSGATTEFLRRESYVQNKWATGAHVTSSARLLFAAFVQWAGKPFDFMGDEDHLITQESGEYFTVVKNYAKDRGCEKQATLNMALQKAVGACIRARLQRVGILLPEAQEQHQRLAQVASRDGSLVTGDLADASNSISLGLVHTHTGGTRWDRLIAATRHATIDVPGHGAVLLEKVSSMGNGFTFELETLLFYSMLKAVCGSGTVSVYGDDLIYEPQYHEAVVDFFEACGFQFNREKSFAAGPFRESCGGHYFKGVDVKPFYIEQLPRTYGQLINLHNDIVRWHVGMRPIEGLLQIARECRRLIPRAFWGPYGEPGVLWSEWDEATPILKRRPGKRELSRVFSADGTAVVSQSYVDGPCFQRWEVKAICYRIPVQKHDYYVGGLLSSLWDPHVLKRGELANRVVRRASNPRYWFRKVIPDGELSGAEFRFAEAKYEVITRRAIDVRHRWGRLPVRV